jgi:hypothetical protein
MLARQAQAFKPLHLFSGTPLTGCWKRTGCRGCLTERRKTLPPSHLGRGHRPCHSARLIPGAPGAQSPRPAPAPPPAGAGLLLFPDLPVCGEPSRTGGETHCVSGSRPHRRKHFHRSEGRGHRPRHSATLTLGQPGAQSPRPAPAPPPAGASRPPGRALASRGAWTCRSTGNRCARAGKRMRFLVPPGDAVALTMPECPVTLAGAIAPATAPH